MILYRPVGEKERILLEESGYRAFPPRLPEQPIFYPVLNERYAFEIASRWNLKDVQSDFKGYVTSFEVDDQFLAAYEVQTVGRYYHQEYWIPAEELEEFNRHIKGKIQIRDLDIVGRKLKIEELFQGFGASEVALSVGLCWVLNGVYFRLDTINFATKSFFVIEWTQSLSDAEKNLFEDADPFPYDLAEEALVQEVKMTLYGFV